MHDGEDAFTADPFSIPVLYLAVVEYRCFV